MKKGTATIILGILLGILLPCSGKAQDEFQKSAQTSFKFLSVISDARAAAMAEAMTSLQVGSSAMFFNPAAMSGMEKFFDVSVSNNKWIADIEHRTFSMAINPARGNYGVFGFSVQYADYGSFIGTVVNPDPLNPKGYDDVGIFGLNAYAIGVGYAKQVTDRFSVGGQVRLARQDLGDSNIPNEFTTVPIYSDSGNTIIGYADSAITDNSRLNPLVFDFGTQFKTGVKSLTFGMSVRNFSKEIQYVYEQFQLPMVFTLGISMDLMDLLGKSSPNQSLYMCIDASHYRDNPEQLKVGLEYKAMNMFALRGGYVTNTDEGSGLSFGVGVTRFGFSFDYAYTPFGVFDNVQRMTARLSL
ncbi:MAG: PorV/PorQ family protein [Anaerolineae bacterium]|nr:PorV/PorQ family protein [Anaerolineae bacterium]